MRVLDSSAGPGEDVDLMSLRSLLAAFALLARASASGVVRRTRRGQGGCQAIVARPLGEADVLRRLESIVYELLDAHQTTARLADGLDWDPDWLEHLESLRRLQRISREALSAACAAPEPIADQAR